MEQIDKELNKRFSDEKLSIDGFDVEGLWNEISEEINLNGNAKKKRRFLFFGVFFIACLLSLVGIIYLTELPNTKDSVVLVDHNSQKRLSSTEVGSTELSSKEKDDKKLIKSQILEKEGKSLINSIDNKLPSKIEVRPVNPSLSEDSIINTNPITGFYIIGEAPKFISINNSYFDRKNQAMENSISPSLDVDPVSKQDNLLGSTNLAAEHGKMLNKSLALLSSINSDYSFGNRDLNCFELSESSVKKIKTKKILFGLYGGINQISFRSQTKGVTDYDEVRNKTEYKEFGANVGFSIGYIIKNNLLVKSGIEYSESWNRFQYFDARMVSIPKEDEILKVWIDDITGDTLNSMRGDTSIHALHEHNVVHFNRFASIGIPIEIGYFNFRNRWSYGISAGVILNYFYDQTGKTYDLNERISAYKNGDDLAPFKSINIGIRLSPEIGFRINEKIALKLSPNWTIFQSNSSWQKEGIKLKSNRLSLNIGMEYSLTR